MIDADKETWSHDMSCYLSSLFNYVSIYLKTKSKQNILLA
jgi:hypothetical protein